MGTAATSIWGNNATGALYALACFAAAVALGATGVIMAASGKPWTPPEPGQFSAAGLVWNGKRWVKPEPEVTGSGLVAQDGQWVKSEDVKP